MAKCFVDPIKYSEHTFYRHYFRVIIAGGGTGGITVFMGEQLNHTNAEIVYLDFSRASMHIAQTRAKIRGLRNIVWIHNWIEEFRFLGLGLFKDLQCSGVLHHLKRPLYGLNILKDSLTRSGGLGLMLYGKYGRTSVYQTQDLLKIINSYQSDIEIELQNSIHILKILPDYNWFMLNSVVMDHKAGKIGIYDLLLHKRDVAFSIKTLFQWITSSGLNFVDFDDYKKRYSLHTQSIISDTTLARKLYNEGRLKNLCIAELLRGNVFKHDFYASKLRDSVADIQDASNLMYVYGNPYGLKGAMSRKNNRIVLENETFFSSSIVDIAKVKSNGPIIKLGWKLNGFNDLLVNKLLASNKEVKLQTVYKEYKDTLEYNISDQALHRLAKEFYEQVKDTDIFLLKKAHVGHFPKINNYILVQIK